MTKASGASTGRRAIKSRVCLLCLAPAPSKEAIRCGCGGAITTFASKAELRRYGELHIMQKSGEIYGLRAHPRYELIVRPNVSPDGSGLKVGVYTADFEYVLPIGNGAVTVTEEIKPMRVLKSKRNLGKKVPIMTADAALRIKLFETLYGRKVKVIA